MQKLLYAVGGFVLALVILGLALPHHATVSATTRIDAYPATVFAQLNDFRRAALWSPWLASDPNARVDFGGPPRGVGATMTWDGAVIGSGTHIIVASEPFDYVEWASNPGEPGEARSWFELRYAAGETVVTWQFEIDYGYNLVGRYFALLLTGVVRRDYEDGLARLEALVETLPRVDFSDLEIEHLVVDARTIAYLRTMSRPDPAAMSDAMGKAYFKILTFIDRHGLQESGAPLAISRAFSGSDLIFDAAIPVRGVTAETPREDDDVNLGSTYAGPVIRAQHVGSYRMLNRTHRKITAYLAALGIEKNGDPWETYVSDPTRVPEDELLTYVYYPIRSE